MAQYKEIQAESDYYLRNQAPQPSVVSINPKNFTFHLQSYTDEVHNMALLQMKNSMTVRVKPTSMHLKMFNHDHSNDYNIAQGWKPRIPSKRLFDDPRFLLSLERKKIRVINGLRQSQFEAIQSTKNSQFPKDGRATSRAHRASEIYKTSRNVTTSDNIRKRNIQHNSKPVQQQISISPAKIGKTPYLHFNLHHMIKQRKQFKTQKAEMSMDKKKGSNIPYLQFFVSQKFQNEHQKINTPTGDRAQNKRIFKNQINSKNKPNGSLLNKYSEQVKQSSEKKSSKKIAQLINEKNNHIKLKWNNKKEVGQIIGKNQFS